MPCSDDGAAQQYYREQSERVDSLAQMLCAILTADDSVISSITDAAMRMKVTKWWNDHQIADKRRKDAEQKAAQEAERIAKIRQEALAKLNPEEVKILGLR